MCIEKRLWRLMLIIFDWYNYTFTPLYFKCFFNRYIYYCCNHTQNRYKQVKSKMLYMGIKSSDNRTLGHLGSPRDFIGYWVFSHSLGLPGLRNLQDHLITRARVKEEIKNSFHRHFCPFGGLVSTRWWGKKPIYGTHCPVPQGR